MSGVVYPNVGEIHFIFKLDFKKKENNKVDDLGQYIEELIIINAVNSGR